ncbi:MAG: serine/threonine-protein phosphatase [Bacteroidaceae bacterium]|nr:serine/threonine-protein phosphatase [Bacteroidaceae bacterium]
MNTKIQIVSFSHKGNRPNQEDCLCSGLVFDKEPLYYAVVCDGLGGHSNGEIASSLVCESFSRSIENVENEGPVDLVAIFNNALAYAYEQLETYDEGGLSIKRMGTTLTCVLLYKKKALCAHIGDSRIYHIRNTFFRSKILYKSLDHSLVNELIALGKLKPEDVHSHPGRHRITRAMQAYNRVNATIHLCDNVKPGDYFFLCTDGVLEQLTDLILCGILHAKKKGVKLKLREIEKVCYSKTQDNFSSCLIQIPEYSIMQRIKYLSLLLQRN